MTITEGRMSLYKEKNIKESCWNNFGTLLILGV